MTVSSTLHGIGVSTGIVIANALNKKSEALSIPERNIKPDEIDMELARLDDAMDKARSQLEKLKCELSQKAASHSDIIDFQLMMLDDEELQESIHTKLRQKLCCVENAVSMAIEQASNVLLDQDDDYMMERASDIQDVGRRILKNLLGMDENSVETHEDPLRVILVADDLTPSETAHLDTQKYAAFITSSGSRTSHTAILARALGIPAIVAVQEGIDSISDGDTLALDIAAGTIIINPDDYTVCSFLKRDERQKMLMAQLVSESRQPTETQDGYQTSLVANVELPSEALNVRKKFNVGIGLFRTEFLFIDRGRYLSEEEQFEAYKSTVQSAYPFSVIFRTLDIGGDKFISQVPTPHEVNPFMGTRAIRFLLGKPDLFKTQLRAILRASAYGKVRMMFPMVSTAEELELALKYLKEVKDELASRHIPFNDDLDVGCMIEVPSAAILAERLVNYVDFFSIGTNDLVQYSLAVDRANPSIAYLYQPTHPAVLRQIKHVVDTAFANGKWVSVCGEMAGETLYTPLLLGMGIHELSMSPMALASVHKLIRNIKMYEAEELVSKALACKNGAEVEDLCREYLKHACKELINE